MTTKITEAQKIIKEFNWLTSGVRIITLMKRKKEGGETRTDRAYQRFISLGAEQFEEVLEKALKLWTPDQRIYCTVNARDMEKGIRNFKQKMLDNDYQNQESKYNFYVDVWNRLISSLQTPSARKDKFFLIDIDDDDKNNLKANDIVSKLKSEGIKIIKKYRTKNGWHIITEPYMYPKLTPELKKWDNIKIDAMALIKYKQT